MKIYVLLEFDYDSSEIWGVYSTMKKAVEALPYFNMSENNIVEFEVDVPNTGDKYETFHYVNMVRDGTIEGGETVNKPSEVIPVSYINWSREDSSTGMRMGVHTKAKTHEEALSLAHEAIKTVDPIWQVCDQVEHRAPHPSCLFKWHGVYAVHRDLNVARVALMEYRRSGKEEPGILVRGDLI